MSQGSAKSGRTNPIGEWPLSHCHIRSLEGASPLLRGTSADGALAVSLWHSLAVVVVAAFCSTELGSGKVQAKSTQG